MNRIRTAIIALILFLVLLLALLLFAQKDYVFEKEVSIKASPSDVFNYVKFLKNQESYNQWFNQDTNANLDYIGEDGLEGSKLIWQSKKSFLGSGEQVLTSLEYPNNLQMQMHIEDPTMANVKHDIKLVGKGDGTKMKWRITMNFPFPHNFTMLYSNFENKLNQTMEVSLQNVRKNLEK